MESFIEKAKKLLESQDLVDVLRGLAYAILAQAEGAKKNDTALLYCEQCEKEAQCVLSSRLMNDEYKLKWRCGKCGKWL